MSTHVHVRRSLSAALIVALAATLTGRHAVDEEAQAQAATPHVIEVKLGKDVAVKLVRVEAGKFLMGSPQSEQDEYRKVFGDVAANWAAQERQHEVTISRPFYMGVYEVTRGQFAEFVRQESFLTEAEMSQLRWFDPDRPENTWRGPDFTQDDRHPVVCVSWQDAMAFCRWLSRTTGKTFDLATEAEWEYACRGGSTTQFHSGPNAKDLQGFCNIADQTLQEKHAQNKTKHRHNDFVAWRDGHAFTAPVGSYRPNGFGLFDMQGNVREWCKDWFGDRYDGKPRRDPQGPAKTDKIASHATRGGSWASNAARCRSAMRSGHESGYRSNEIGFRVVLRQP